METVEGGAHLAVHNLEVFRRYNQSRSHARIERLGQRHRTLFLPQMQLCHGSASSRAEAISSQSMIVADARGILIAAQVVRSQ
jgi:hypothetical protein